MALQELVAPTARKAPSAPMRGSRNQDWTPPGASCLRCSGLLVPSYTASLERDFTGTPVTLWRCVNCGDCVDRDILANRWNSPVPACETADSRANIVLLQPVKNGVFEVRRAKADAVKRHTSTVKIDHVLVSRISSHERSSHHG